MTIIVLDDEDGYWAGVIEANLHRAIVRRAEEAAHDERRERMLDGRDTVGFVAGAFATRIYDRINDAAITLRPGDRITLATSALSMSLT